MAGKGIKKHKRRTGKKLKRPVVLIILDGWAEGPDDAHYNAIVAAKTPFYDSLKKKYPFTTLKCWGEHVGLPKGQPGNSEAGHLTIGAGRHVKQDVEYINASMADGTFFKNTAFKEAIKHIKKYNQRLHLMGLLSNGESAHASDKHLYALIDLARQYDIKKTFIHLFTDGRDSSRFAALKLLTKLEKKMNRREKIASVTGRFYAMDRNKNWRRTELAYDAIACGRGLVAEDARSAIIQAYNRNETDEFILPTLIRDGNGHLVSLIEDNDAVIFYNLRSDRARQLTKAFVQKDFEKINTGAFKRKCVPDNIRFVALTDFGPDLPDIFTAFPGRDVEDGLVEEISYFGMRQIHISESEKFAHVTYFLNGGYAEPMKGERRIKIESPDLPTYQAKPEMASFTIAGEAIDAIAGNRFEFMAINFAAPDMIGHTGDYRTAVKTAEAIDKCLAKIIRAVRERKGTAIVTADHGNIDEMRSVATGEIMTKHSLNPVPFILVDEELKNRKLTKGGDLSNVAPTILEIMGIPKPKKMTSKSLLK